MLALMIAAEARADGTHAVYGVEALAGDSGLSTATVKRRLAQLKATGWLAVEERGHRRWHGKPIATRYRLLSPASTAQQGEPLTGAQQITQVSHRASTDQGALSTDHSPDPLTWRLRINDPLSTDHSSEPPLKVPSEPPPRGGASSAQQPAADVRELVALGYSTTHAERMLKAAAADPTTKSSPLGRLRSSKDYREEVYGQVKHYCEHGISHGEDIVTIAGQVRRRCEDCQRQDPAPISEGHRLEGSTRSASAAVRATSSAQARDSLRRHPYVEPPARDELKAVLGDTRDCDCGQVIPARDRMCRECARRQVREARAG